jgi:biotin transport system substrate-specific component
MLCGTAALYACGLQGLKLLTGLSWPKVLAAGMLPFLPGDALKIAVAVPIARALRPIIGLARPTDGQQPATRNPQP